MTVALICSGAGSVGFYSSGLRGAERRSTTGVGVELVNVELVGVELLEAYLAIEEDFELGLFQLAKVRKTKSVVVVPKC